jgi:glycerophosphoryl diester phosphodiesterase
MKHSPLLLALAMSIPASAQDAGASQAPPPALHVVDPKTPEGLRKLLRHTGRPIRLVSAHRGGAGRDYPENCIATFEHTLAHTAALMEVDPRYTKDGAIVLHHDATLDRTTNGTGRVSDHTLPELRRLRLKDAAGNLTPHVMPTLDEALVWARGKTVLILDRKGILVEDRVKKIEEHKAEAYAMVMAYTFEEARTCHRLNRDIMMEIFVPDRKALAQFEKTGVPWSRVVAFVGHEASHDPELCALIHTRGAICIAGTSRNLDRQVIRKQVPRIAALEPAYRAILAQGIDVIETDIPVAVGSLLFKRTD